jgi:hypothetical protein
VPERPEPSFRSSKTPVCTTVPTLQCDILASGDMAIHRSEDPGQSGTCRWTLVGLAHVHLIFSTSVMGRASPVPVS